MIKGLILSILLLLFNGCSLSQTEPNYSWITQKDVVGVDNKLISLSFTKEEDLTGMKIDDLRKLWKTGKMDWREYFCI